jgi:predicted site-specific integrase-resolvase
VVAQAPVRDTRNLNRRISAKVAEKLLNIPHGTLNQWRKDGRGPVPMRSGNRVWYEIGEIYRFDDETRTAHQPLEMSRK